MRALLAAGTIVAGILVALSLLWREPRSEAVQAASADDARALHAELVAPGAGDGPVRTSKVETPAVETGVPGRDAGNPEAAEPYSVDVYAWTSSGESLAHAIAAVGSAIGEQLRFETDTGERLTFTADRDVERSGYAGTLNLRSGGDRRISLLAREVRLAEAHVQRSAPRARFVLDVDQVLSPLEFLELHAVPGASGIVSVVVFEGTQLRARDSTRVARKVRLGPLAPGEYQVVAIDEAVPRDPWKLPFERAGRVVYLAPGQTLDLGELRGD